MEEVMVALGWWRAAAAAAEEVLRRRRVRERARLLTPAGARASRLMLVTVLSGASSFRRQTGSWTGVIIFH